MELILSMIFKSDIIQWAISGFAVLLTIWGANASGKRKGRMQEKNDTIIRSQKEAELRRKNRVEIDRRVVNDIDDPGSELQDHWSRD